jgi:hypothetical protein
MPQLLISAIYKQQAGCCCGYFGPIHNSLLELELGLYGKKVQQEFVGMRQGHIAGTFL